MINLQFNIRIPGSNRFRNIRCWHGIVPKCQHKFWEIHIYQGSDVVDIFLRLTGKQDHAGLNTGIGLLGYNIELNVYDSRHWNTDTNDWC